MPFFVRVFSMAEDIPSRNSICDELLEEDYEFMTSPGKEEPEFREMNWTSMSFQYREGGPVLELERNTPELDGALFSDEKKEFQDIIEGLPYGKHTKRVKGILDGLKQIYAFRIEEEMDEEGWQFLETILDYICDGTDGYVQIDGEGIYDREGRLMLEFD